MSANYAKLQNCQWMVSYVVNCLGEKAGACISMAAGALFFGPEYSAAGIRDCNWLLPVGCDAGGGQWGVATVASVFGSGRILVVTWIWWVIAFWAHEWKGPRDRGPDIVGYIWAWGMA